MVFIIAAKAEYTAAVQSSRADVEQFQALRAEYRRDPQLLLDRLWQQTERRILGASGVTKYYLPRGQKEFRIHIGPDPRDKRADEVERYQDKPGDQLEGIEGLNLGVASPARRRQRGS